MPRLEWNQATDLWRNLRSLEFGVCSGLSLTMLKKILSQLTILHCAILPDSIVENEADELVNEAMKSLRNNQACWLSFNSIGYFGTRFYQNCAFQPDDDEDDESDNESTDESDNDLSDDWEDDV